MRKRKFQPPVDLKPLKILKQKLDWMITSSTPTTLPILWKSVQRGLFPYCWNITHLWLCVPFLPFPSFSSCRRLQQKRVDGFSRCIHCENSSNRFCCRWRQEKRKGKGHKVTRGYISAIWGADPIGPISIKNWQSGMGWSVIIQSNFGFSIFKGFRSTGDQNFRFPIDFAGHRYNLSLIHIWRCRRIERCRSRWSPYH